MLIKQPAHAQLATNHVTLGEFNSGVWNPRATNENMTTPVHHHSCPLWAPVWHRGGRVVSVSGAATYKTLSRPGACNAEQCVTRRRFAPQLILASVDDIGTTGRSAH